MKHAIILALIAGPAVAAVVDHDPQPWRGWCAEPGVDDILRDPLASIVGGPMQARSRYYETPDAVRLSPGGWVDGAHWRGRTSPSINAVASTPAGGVSVATPAPIPLPAIGSGLLFAALGAAVALWWRR